MSQAKQLIEAKNELEEAMIQIRSIGRPEWHRTEIAELVDRIKLSDDAKRSSRKALDDLTVTFREVAVEASLTNARLLLAENDLADVKDQIECTKSTLRNSDEKYRASLEEIDRLRKEIEEWMSKRRALQDRISLMEVEIEQRKKETARLIEARQVSKEETTQIKETLEIALTENSRLKNLISEKYSPPKENDLADVRDQIECSKSTMRSSDEKHRDSLEEIDKLRKEIEEWMSERRALQDRIRLMEIEIERRKKETARLIEARQVSKEETTKIKEALEIALTENSRLKNLISEKYNPPKEINTAPTEISGSMNGNRRHRSWSNVKDFVRSNSPNFGRRNSDHTTECGRRESSKWNSVGFNRRPSMRDLFSKIKLSFSSSANTKKIDNQTFRRNN
ncbi:hypothetical protein ZOSMA_68G00770 [Zostera marina]|uniref:Uncharacterized protein n=1 Tax=Zostera marina TaxID=29655 RepID=A0A0K9NU59_ZOSMR|nr:hypothetical protein ZOSMA_68G00770 [Zostera marina]